MKIISAEFLPFHAIHFASSVASAGSLLSRMIDLLRLFASVSNPGTCQTCRCVSNSDLFWTESTHKLNEAWNEREVNEK